MRSSTNGRQRARRRQSIIIEILKMLAVPLIALRAAGISRFVMIASSADQCACFVRDFPHCWYLSQALLSSIALERNARASLNSGVNNGYSHLPDTPDAERLGKGVPPERCHGVLGSRRWATPNLRAREGAPSARADRLASLIELERPGASAYQSRQVAAHLRLTAMSICSNIGAEQFRVK